MVITTSVETLDGSWIYCYISCILGRAPRTKETLPNFCENMSPDKWDITVWYRVTRNPQEFYGLTSCQRDPRVLGRHMSRGPIDVPKFCASTEFISTALTRHLMFGLYLGGKPCNL